MAKINFGIIWKSIVIGVLILIMLIPLAFVSGTIKGRLEYKEEAISKITQSWGDKVLIAAPILNIPYTIRYQERAGSAWMPKTEYAKFSPKNIETTVNIESQTRYIGIFKVPVFKADIVMKGSFDAPQKFPDSNENEAFVSLEINDLKGISSPEFVWNGTKSEFEPTLTGTPLRMKQMGSYISKFSSRKYYEYDAEETMKSLSSKIILKEDNSFELKFSVKGSNAISFIPLGKDAKFNISSDWTNPNFSGNFLPDNKTITNDGFSAQWNINYLASGIPLRLEGADLSSAMFTTNFIVPVDNYRSAERATKYGILFIILTFLACFIFEISSKKPIHPFQYLLVGFAMAIFYILLISISEFIAFSYAYLIAAAAVIILITAYTKFALIKDLSVKQTVIVAAFLTALYAYLYILLQLQDMALIFGAISLFIGLAIVMYATRNIKWYDEIE